MDLGGAHAGQAVPQARQQAGRGGAEAAAGEGGGAVGESEVDLREVRMESLIGGGSFGEVHKGSWRGTLVAVKLLKVMCFLACSPNLQS